MPNDQDENVQNIHATSLLYNGVGILLRGKSGAGKSVLALDLLDQAALRHEKAQLIADDRTLIYPHAEALWAKCPASIEGKIELRGYGILTRPFCAQAKIDVCIDLVESPIRLPEPQDQHITMMNIELPRYFLGTRAVMDPVHQRLIVWEILAKYMPKP